MGRGASGGEMSLERLAGAGSQEVFYAKRLGSIGVGDGEAFEDFMENYMSESGKP